MTAPEVLARIRAAGGKVVLRDGQPVARMPRGYNPELLAEARAVKAELAGLLAPEAAEAVARNTAERVRAAMAGYPADDAEVGEREAIEAEAKGELPEPAGLTPGYLAGLRRAALLRPPVVIAAALPAGATCSACRGRRWWVSRVRGPAVWRCCGCHPPRAAAGAPEPGRAA